MKTSRSGLDHIGLEACVAYADKRHTQTGRPYLVTTNWVLLDTPHSRKLAKEASEDILHRSQPTR